MHPARNVDAFSPEVGKKLGSYVYRLIDPRNGETFYIGKGVGDRIFAHVQGLPSSSDDDEDVGLPEKLERVRAIRNAGLEVIHIVHRHGMNEETAFAVEAALIDMVPGLSNLCGGHDSGERGPMHVWEIQQRYEAKEADFAGHKVLLISVNRSATEKNLYDSTRYAWRLDAKRAMHAEVILATQQGLIIGAYVAEQWLPSTPENFPGFPAAEGRWGFVGREAPKEIVDLYLQKRVPDGMRKRGAANPIRYSW